MAAKFVEVGSIDVTTVSFAKNHGDVYQRCVSQAWFQRGPVMIHCKAVMVTIGSLVACWLKGHPHGDIQGQAGYAESLAFVIAVSSKTTPGAVNGR